MLPFSTFSQRVLAMPLARSLAMPHCAHTTPMPKRPAGGFDHERQGDTPEIT